MCLPEQNGVLKDTPFLASLESDSCGSINLCYSVSLFSLSTNIYFSFSVENWFLLQDHVSVIRDDLGGRLGQVNWSLNIMFLRFMHGEVRVACSIFLALFHYVTVTFMHSTVSEY